MSPHPPIPEPLWKTVPLEAQAALLEAFGSLEIRIAELEKTIAELHARLNLNSTNSSKPPSTDPPAVKLKRRPPVPPSGRKRGGQPGHKRHTRALVPPEKLRETFEVRPTKCQGCGAALQGDDPNSPETSGRRDPARPSPKKAELWWNKGKGSTFLI